MQYHFLCGIVLASQHKQTFEVLHRLVCPLRGLESSECADNHRYGQLHERLVQRPDSCCTDLNPSTIVHEQDLKHSHGIVVHEQDLKHRHGIVVHEQDLKHSHGIVIHEQDLKHRHEIVIHEQDLKHSRGIVVHEQDLKHVMEL